MENYFSKNFPSVRLGAILSLLTILFGFGVGVAFGLYEDDMKKNLKDKALMTVEADKSKPLEKQIYKGDMAKVDKISNKSFKYLIRAHLHSSGLGAIAMSLIILLSFMTGVPSVVRWIVSFMLGLGSLMYSMAWMYAGLKAPLLGSTGAAKQSLYFMAGPSIVMCVVGVFAVLVLVVYQAYIKKES